MPHCYRDSYAIQDHTVLLRPGRGNIPNWLSKYSFKSTTIWKQRTVGKQII